MAGGENRQIDMAGHEAIAAAKALVVPLLISVAASYAARGIRINAVAPRLVKTPMTTRITNNELSLKTSVAMHPLGWIGVDGGLGALKAK